MNDHDAIDAITKIFDDYCDNGLHEFVALNSIARVIGLNTMHHIAAKQANQ